MKELFGLVKEVKPAIEVPFDTKAKWSEVGLDSLDVVELVARVEQSYRIEIENDEWQGLNSMAALAEHLALRSAAHG